MTYIIFEAISDTTVQIFEGSGYSFISSTNFVIQLQT